jgi:hypothetical protein
MVSHKKSSFYTLFTHLRNLKLIIRKWTSDSFKYFEKILNSHQGGQLGFTKTSGYILYKDITFEEPVFKDIVYDFRRLEHFELEKLPGEFK